LAKAEDKNQDKHKKNEDKEVSVNKVDLDADSNISANIGSSKQEEHPQKRLTRNLNAF